jgi:uracil-DNA glycosylase
VRVERLGEAQLSRRRAEMPKKYWRDLPESSLIPGLIAAAAAREYAMVEHSVTPPARRKAPRADRTSRVAGGDELDRLRKSAARCRDCPLFEDATQTVFGAGPKTARVMLVGEQPGDQEDLRGEPFVGPAGTLLNRALDAAGVDRGRLYVTNAVKHFKFVPRGKRRLHKTPSQSEIEACRQWLEKELAAIRPRLVVPLGATAARAIVGKAVPVQKSRGTIFSSRDAVTGSETDLLVTVHPSYLLRLDHARREAELGAFVADLELIRPYLD